MNTPTLFRPHPDHEHCHRLLGMRVRPAVPARPLRWQRHAVQARSDATRGRRSGASIGIDRALAPGVVNVRPKLILRLRSPLTITGRRCLVSVAALAPAAERVKRGTAHAAL